MTHRYYISTRFKNRELAKELRRLLGDGCTAQWIDRKEQYSNKGKLKEYAEEDFIDIRAADAFYILTENCEAVPGGMWVELGYAMALEKFTTQIGPDINIFSELIDRKVKSMEEL